MIIYRKIPFCSILIALKYIVKLNTPNNYFLYMFTTAWLQFSQKIIDNFSAYNCNITCALALPAPHDGRIQKLNLIFCL